MRRRDQLRHQARAVAERRGHKLGPFIPSEFRGKDVASAHCQNMDCTCSAHVITNPRPNETAISGTAVAINCVSIGGDHD